jgi:hypothetical protein
MFVVGEFVGQLIVRNLKGGGGCFVEFARADGVVLEERSGGDVEEK